MELPDDIPHRAPPRHSIDVRHNAGSRHSIDLSRAHSVRTPAAAQPSHLSRGTGSQNDNSPWDNVSEENKGIIRQVSCHLQQCFDVLTESPAGLGLLPTAGHCRAENQS